MIRQGAHLGLDVPGLREGRPSLLKGDSVVARSPVAGLSTPKFQGFIHEVSLLVQ